MDARDQGGGEHKPSPKPIPEELDSYLHLQLSLYSDDSGPWYNGLENIACLWPYLEYPMPNMDFRTPNEEWAL